MAVFVDKHGLLLSTYTSFLSLIRIKKYHLFDRVVPAANRKNKAISARVYGSTYNQFKKICDAKGLTANACLNMLIADFVRENKTAIE